MPANGSPTALVDEWAACERAHGDVNQADPIIDTHGVINITVPGPSGGRAPGHPMSSAGPVGNPHDATGTCSQYLIAAQVKLRAEDPVSDPQGVTNTATIIAFATCMRANGVPNYPYPSGPGDRQTNFIGTGVDPNSPQVVRVNDYCGKKLGLPAWWINGWGPPGDISVGMAGLPGEGNPPACMYSKDGCGSSGGIVPAHGANGGSAQAPRPPTNG